MKRNIMIMVAVALAAAATQASAASITTRSAADTEIASIPNETDDKPAAKQLTVKAAAAATTETAAALPSGEPGLSFNFRNASLDTVLDYMSKAGGFVVVKLVSTDGRVNIASHQPLSRAEAVELLNTVLNESGYAAVRNGRILKIVTRDEARKYKLPVLKLSEPEQMGDTDDMVTNIIAIRYTDASSLLNDIQPLLADWSTISANATSNSIVITDTKSNIKRVAEIIKALDTPNNAVAAIEVYVLQSADATQVADMVNQLFANQSGNTGNNRGSRQGGNPFTQLFQMRGRGGMGGGMGNQQGDQSARQAASRVLAVADVRANAVIVSAPDELHPTIAKVIEQVDSTKELETQIRVFPLQYADASEMTDVISKMYADSNTATGTVNNRNQQGGGRGGFQGMNRGAVQTASMNGRTARQIQEHTVTVVADTRTNSVIVIAVESVLDQVGVVIGNLDKDSAGHMGVHTYKIHNTDPESVATLLQSTFQSGSTGRGSSSTNRSGSNYSSSSSNRNSSANRNSGGSSSSRNSGSGSSSSFGRSSGGSSRSY